MSEAAVRLAALLRETASAAALGHLILRGDAWFRHIPVTRHGEMVANALSDGERWAAVARARWGSRPEVIAQSLGLRVREVAQEQGIGTTTVFAEYCSRRSIDLYQQPIERLNAALADPSWNWVGIVDATPVFLAHEIYHHLDIASGTPVARRDPVVLLQLGAWRWTSGIPALSEIAAGSFAQDLLCLPIHPKLLDFLLMNAADPDNALSIAVSLTNPVAPSRQ